MDSYKKAHTAVITYTLNLLDLFCTLWALQRGVAELNLLMRSVPFMVCYKVIIVGMLLRWLSTRKERMVQYALCSITVVYGAVCLWHVVGIWMLMS